MVACLALWMGLGAWRAHHDLTGARRDVSSLTAQLEAEHLTGAAEHARAISHRADAAYRWTHDPVWWAASRLPVVGERVRAVRDLTAAARITAHSVMTPTVEAALALSADKLRKGPGRLDLAPLGPALGHVTSALSGSTRARSTLEDPKRFPGRLGRARRDFLDRLDAVDARLRGLRTALEVVPTLLGRDGPRRILVAFQNNAEVRATGGLVGSLGILEADNGRLHLVTVGSQALLGGEFPKPVVDLGADFNDRYGSFGAAQTFVNSNTSAHFPYAGQIWQRMWELRYPGQRIDAALAIDPVALSYLLQATGPVTVAGRVLGAQNLTSYVESDIYREFSASQTEARKTRLAEVARAVFQRLIDAPGSAVGGLVSGLRRAADERRLLIWSADPAVEQRLAATPVGGVVPDDDTSPYAQLVLTNESGSKLDYYISATLDYTGTACGDKPRRATRARVTLRNDAPTSGLPPYVTIRADANTVEGGRAPGYERLEVSLYASRGAEFSAVRVNGHATGAFNERDRGHPVYSVELVVPPGGGTATVEWDLDEPSLRGQPTALVPATVRPSAAHVAVPAC